MRNLVYHCTVGSLRITAPVPRTWIPVNRDMPQVPTTGTPATAGTVHAVLQGGVSRNKDGVVGLGQSYSSYQLVKYSRMGLSHRAR